MAKKGPVIDLLAWQEEIARRVAYIGRGQSAVLCFDAKATTAYTDGRTITCPLPPMDASHEDFLVLRGQIIHEVGHLMRPEVFDLLKDKKVDTKTKFGILINQIEDRVQEASVAGAHRGDMVSLDRLHSITTRRGHAKLTTEGLAPQCDVDATSKLWATMIIGITGARWMTETIKAVTSGNCIVNRFLPEVAGWVETLEKEGWGAKISKPMSVPEVYDLALSLFKRLFPDDPDPEEQAKKAAARGAGKTAGEAEKDGESVGGTIPWWLVTLTNHTDDDDSRESRMHPSRIDWTGKEYNGRVPDLITDIGVINEFSGHGSHMSDIMRNIPEGKFPSSLVGEARRRLQAKTRCRWRNEKQDGRLDTRSVGRLVLPQVGDGTFNRSIFKKKDPGLKLDVSVSILVDSSGSMNGSKYVNASIAAMALNELCQRALRVPSEIIGFSHSSGSGTPQMYIHKSFSQRALSRDTLANTLGSRTVKLDGNSDAEAVMYAVGRIRKQHTARKVVVVLSDGSPADSKAESMDVAFDNLKKIISLVRKSGDVELYGIGISDDNVRKFYSKNAPVVENPSDIATAVLDVLSDVLQKRPDGGV